MNYQMLSSFVLDVEGWQNNSTSRKLTESESSAKSSRIMSASLYNLSLPFVLTTQIQVYHHLQQICL